MVLLSLKNFPYTKFDPRSLDPRYLAILLRSHHFQRAIRAITTGHSNRRRTQPEDFENLPVFVPDLDVQRNIADAMDARRASVRDEEQSLRVFTSEVEKVVLGQLDPIAFLKQIGTPG